MTSRESTQVRPAETDTDKEEQSKEEQKALTTKKHQYYSALFVIILMVVGNVVTLVSVEKTGAGKIFMAGVMFSMWASALVFALLLAHEDMLLQLFAVIFAHILWWNEWLSGRHEPITIAIVDIISPINVYLSFQYAAAALRVKAMQKFLKTQADPSNETLMNPPNKTEMARRQNSFNELSEEMQKKAKVEQLVGLTDMASDISKKYLGTLPIIYYFVLEVVQKTLAEPQLVQKVCDMYKLSHPNESMAHVNSCNGCYNNPPCFAMVSGIAVADVPSSVNEINLDAAFGDESINFTEWRVSFLSGAEISFLFFCTIVLVNIRGKKVSDWLTCAGGCTLLCCNRCNTKGMFCGCSTKGIEDTPHINCCEGFLGFIIVLNVCLMTTLGALSLDTMEYKEMRMLIFNLYNAWGILMQLMMFCLIWLSWHYGAVYYEPNYSRDWYWCCRMRRSRTTPGGGGG